MKKLTKLFGLCMVLTLLVNMFALVSVFAGTAHLDYIKWNLYDSEVVTVSIDVKKNDSYKYGFEIETPQNTSDIYNTQSKYSAGMITFTSDNTIKVKGGWNFDAADGQSAGQLTTGAWTNITFRFNKTDKKTDVYVDGQYGCTVTSVSAGSIVYQVTQIIVFYDNANTEGKDFEYKLNSVYAAKANEIEVENIDVNKGKGEIRAELSEELKSSSKDKLENTVLKNANTNKSDLTITNVNCTGNIVTYTYSGEMEDYNDYVLIFPEGLEGKLGKPVDNEVVEYYKLTNRYVHLNSGAKQLKYSDYEGEINIDSDIVMWDNAAYIYPRNIETDTGFRGASLQVNNVVIDNTVAIQNWKNLPTITEDYATLSFDIKPYKSDLKGIIEFDDAGFKKAPMVIGFTKSGMIRLGDTSDNGGWTNAAWYDNVTWGVKDMTTISGGYKTGSWMHFDMVYDGSADTVDFYINGVKKHTDTNKSSAADVFGGVRLRVFDKYEDKENIFALDNVKITEGKASFSVDAVKFNSASDSVGSFETLGTTPESIDVYFNGTPDINTLNATNIKVKYDGIEVSCSGSYNSEKGAYEITGLPTYDAYKVEVTCENVTDGENTAPAYKTHAYGCTESAAVVTDESGNVITSTNAAATVYMKSFLVNDTDIATGKILLFLAAYDEAGVLTNIKTQPVESVGAREAYITSKDSAPVSLDLEEAAASVKCFMWLSDGLTPLNK